MSEHFEAHNGLPLRTLESRDNINLAAVAVIGWLELTALYSSSTIPSFQLWNGYLWSSGVRTQRPHADLGTLTALGMGATAGDGSDRYGTAAHSEIRLQPLDVYHVQPTVMLGIFIATGSEPYYNGSVDKLLQGSMLGCRLKYDFSDRHADYAMSLSWLRRQRERRSTQGGLQEPGRRQVAVTGRCYEDTYTFPEIAWPSFRIDSSCNAATAAQHSRRHNWRSTVRSIAYTGQRGFYLLAQDYVSPPHAVLQVVPA
ncbi:hypothetical protein C8T65DRAFT_698491 [Cerioporus squamosus]|nr:hypothetical protein C8T65DRAFT_698491 [Cerioporus squamosus]